MKGPIAQTPTSLEILDSELSGQPRKARLWHIIGLISQTAPLRWWFGRYSRSAAESELANIPLYPGA
jgi:hypothetical protein